MNNYEGHSQNPFSRVAAAEFAQKWQGTIEEQQNSQAFWQDFFREIVGIQDLQAEGIEFEKATFPWAASGRSLATGRDEGITKLLFDKNTKRLIGAAIVGSNAGELIGETVLALEMGADAEDIGLTIHPHPTLSESIFFAAEIAEGSITDLYMPKKKL